MDMRVKSHLEPILASPIIVKSTAKPVRIILYRKGSEYVTHEEQFVTTTPDGTDSCRFVHSGLLDGGYFRFGMFSSYSEQEARYHAEADYNERVRKLFTV